MKADYAHRERNTWGVRELSVATKESEVQEKLRALIRHAAEQRVRIYSRRDDFSLMEAPKGIREGAVLGNWMAMILMGGESVRITLKLHFAYQDVRALAYPIYGASKPEAVSDQQATDFVKELCNLMAGYIVQIFEENDLSLGISLPLCTRGLYEIFADYKPASQPLIRYSDIWVMQDGDVRIPGTVLVEIMDENALENLLDYDPNADGADDDDDDEGFDFL